MTSDTQLSVTGSHVIAETIDGETVVINLETGLYFSLVGTASEVWEAVRAGTTRAALLVALGARYAASPDAIAEATDAFLEAMAADGLLRREASEAGSTPEPAAATNGQRPPFVPPTLQRFHDVQDLLLLDPIHEVDERGWPNLPES